MKSDKKTNIPKVLSEYELTEYELEVVNKLRADGFSENEIVGILKEM